jgi:ribonuclease HI
MQVEIYTDGSSRGNPGRGGYGVILKYGQHERELSQGYRLTTNNRMELLATIAGLETLTRDKLNVTIYSDSKYVVESVEKKWVLGWEKKNYKDKKNADLWQRFLIIYRKHHVKFVWIRGHNDHPFNERCDVLATQAADYGPWHEDVGYVASM